MESRILQLVYFLSVTVANVGLGSWLSGEIVGSGTHGSGGVQLISARAGVPRRHQHEARGEAQRHVGAAMVPEPSSSGAGASPEHPWEEPIELRQRCAASMTATNLALSGYSIAPGQPSSLPRLRPPPMEALRKKRVPLG
jgi:hypothetical protein